MRKYLLLAITFLCTGALMAGCEDDDDSPDETVSESENAEASPSNSSELDKETHAEPFSIFGTWTGTSGANKQESALVAVDNIDSSPADDFTGILLRGNNEFKILGHYPGDPGSVTEVPELPDGASTDVDVRILESPSNNLLEKWRLHIDGAGSLTGLGIYWGTIGSDELGATGQVFAVKLSK